MENHFHCFSDPQGKNTSRVSNLAGAVIKMKLLLKLFLILCVVLAGFYAATPLWLSHILARQLPPGWQLEELQSGYPGLTGISVGLLRTKGAIGPVSIALSSSDLRLTYQGLKTNIGLVSVDVFRSAPQSGGPDIPTLKDLSLPVTKLTGKLPQLSVDKIQVRVHKETGLLDVVGRPLLVDFESFDLNPRSEDSYQLSSQVLIDESLRFKGQLKIDVSPNLIDAIIRFPSSTGPSPWLVLALKQEDLPAETTTRLDAVLNADLANREWLDSVLAGATGRVFTQLGGKFAVHAGFSDRNLQNQDVQEIERLSLTTENLQLLSDTGMLGLSAELLANRDGDKLTINLPAPASISFQGDTSWVYELIQRAIPALQLTPRPQATIQTVLGSNSSFIVQTGISPSMNFIGDINIELQSSAQDMTLQSTGLQLEMADLQAPALTKAEGLLALDLKVNTPFSYTSDSVQLDADKASILADLTLQDGTYFSTGAGTLALARITPGAVSADKIEMDWKELDLLKLTGNLDIHTQGFVTEFDNETWTGFDFDIKYRLLSETDSSGTGIMKFNAGTEIPFEFAGNAKDQRWSIKVLPASVELAKLKKLLSVAHHELPSSIKLTDGRIELQGDIQVDKEISAQLLINGYEAGASMLKSSARKASFTFNTSYDKTLTAIGPVSIEALNLAGGIDVTNIKTGLEFEDTEHFELKDIYAEVFDGQLQLEELQYSESRISETTIELRHINLEKLLDYADIDGLAGTGFLDFSLPVGSDQAGIYVSAGTFHSTGVGRLAYTKEGVAGSNIGLQALENFHYKDLSGTLNYQSDGNYVITIRLEGKNPDLYGGHPVVFNLNINGLLPALFEAMFMTGSFEESILKQIKSR